MPLSVNICASGKLYLSKEWAKLFAQEMIVRSHAVIHPPGVPALGQDHGLVGVYRLDRDAQRVGGLLGRAAAGKDL